jgi:hypothetical protein
VRRQVIEVRDFVGPLPEVAQVSPQFDPGLTNRERAGRIRAVLEGLGVVIQRLVQCEDPCGLLCRPNAPRDGLFGLSSLLEVMGNSARRAIQPLEGCGQLLVQQPGASGAHALAQRLANQVVAKAETVLDGLQQPGIQRGFQRIQGFPFGEGRGPGQFVQTNAFTDQAGRLEQALHAAAQAIHPFQHGIAHAFGDGQFAVALGLLIVKGVPAPVLDLNLAGAEETPDGLEHEERITAGALIKPPGEDWGRLL